MSYPTPILNLDFVNAKQLGDKVAFSRASNGTFWDRNGVLRTAVDNMPRFDHDPLTGICKGLLVEPQVAFLDTHSEQFDDAAWTKSRVAITPNAAVAPDGATTADKLVEDTTANDSHNVRRIYSGLTAGVAYTQKITLQAAERSWAIVTIGNSGYFPAACFDLSNGSSGTVSDGLAVNIVNIGNGRYDCYVTFTAATTSAAVYILVSTGNNIQSYTGDGTSGIYLWGAKLYAGTGPTSYLPSVASLVTRAADIASVDLTQLKGPAGEALWDGSEGTVVVRFSQPFFVTNKAAASLRSSVSTNNSITILTHPIIYTLAGGMNKSSNVIGSAPGDGATVNIAFAFDSSGDFKYSRDGGLPSALAGFAFPAGMDQLRLGDLAGASTLGGHIRSIKLYNRRIADAYLPALSAL